METDEFDDGSFPTPESERKRREASIAEPGPPWRTWVFETGLRPYFLLMFLILDAWLVTLWYEVGSALGLVLTLIPAIYAEFLLYRYLWTRPDLEAPRPFRRTWYRPVWAGRWTAEGIRLRAGAPMPGPDPSRKREEFL
jgi:hypothetical protein